jgi:hypothetical protein
MPQGHAPNHNTHHSGSWCMEAERCIKVSIHRSIHRSIDQGFQAHSGALLRNESNGRCRAVRHAKLLRTSLHADSLHVVE